MAVAETRKSAGRVVGGWEVERSWNVDAPRRLFSSATLQSKCGAKACAERRVMKWEVRGELLAWPSADEQLDGVERARQSAALALALAAAATARAWVPHLPLGLRLAMKGVSAEILRRGWKGG